MATAECQAPEDARFGFSLGRGARAASVAQCGGPDCTGQFLFKLDATVRWESYDAILKGAARNRTSSFLRSTPHAGDVTRFRDPCTTSI